MNLRNQYSKPLTNHSQQTSVDIVGSMLRTSGIKFSLTDVTSSLPNHLFEEAGTFKVIPEFGAIYPELQEWAMMGDHLELVKFNEEAPVPVPSGETDEEAISRRLQDQIKSFSLCLWNFMNRHSSDKDVFMYSPLVGPDKHTFRIIYYRYKIMYDARRSAIAFSVFFNQAHLDLVVKRIEIDRLHKS